MDAALAGRQERMTIEQLGQSLHADVTIGATDLALVRGRLAFERLAARRDDAVGKLALDVAEVRCELPPLGLALVDGECRELHVRGTRLEASTTALFEMHHPKRPPLRARRVVLDDAALTLAPHALAASFGGATVVIEHAEANATSFRTPLSFLFALDELRARIELPGNVRVALGYHSGVLSVAGALLGATPVELPIELPSASAAHDAREEIELLVDLAKTIAERVVAQRARDWLRSKLSP
jgi:hypothetical protein